MRMDWQVATAVLLLAASTGKADLIFPGTPVNAWAYSHLPESGTTKGPTYYPQSTSDYQGAQFVGYVTYNNTIGGSFGPIYGTNGLGYHIFTTYLTASQDMTIPIRVGGDDGHSLFINDTFVGGSAFGQYVLYDLQVTAGSTTKIEVAGYEAGGGWVFFTHALSDGVTLLENVPGVTLNAVGHAPEPTSLALLGLGGVSLLGSAWRHARRRRTS